MNLLRPRSHVTKVRHEDDGGLAGLQREHWNDAVDAKVFARGQVHIPSGGFSLAGHGHLFRAPQRPPEFIRTARGRVVPVLSGGAFSVSGLYVDNFIDVLDATQLAIDLSLTSHKIALFTNTETPDYSADVSYNSTGESSGTGYTAGGQVVVSPTVTESPAGTLMYDLGDQVWAAPTSVTARGCEEYADALAGDNLIVGVAFGSDFTSTAGTFTIQWNSLGVFTIDLTP